MRTEGKSSSSTRWYLGNCELFQGILTFSTENLLRVICPLEWRNKLMNEAHSEGHFGADKTRKKLHLFHWYRIENDIRDFVTFCAECQMRSRKINKVPLQPSKVSVVFEKMAIDLCGPLPQTERGNAHIANFVDLFSKYVISVPVENTKAKTIATAFLREVVYKFGTPTELVSDNATNFNAENMKQLCLDLQVKKVFVTPYHSTSNGAVERTFRTW